MKRVLSRWILLFGLLVAVLAPPDMSTTSPGHSVTLNWNASTSLVVGYNVYRATQAAGPYTKLNPSPIKSTSYIDGRVRAGATYFYAVTPVDRKGLESMFSNEVQASVPSPYGPENGPLHLHLSRCCFSRR